MILGLSGLAGSGKDTVADILVSKHGFVKVALADPLKRICKEVYDFSDEQLWGPSEMRNAPDKRYPTGRWDKYAWCCAACTEAVHGTSFEEKTPGLLSEGRDCAVCDGYTLGKDLHFVPTPAFLTPRYALQRLGTEWGRDCYDNTWVDLAIRTAKKLLEGSSVYSQRHGLVLGEDFKIASARLYAMGESMAAPPCGVVIPDVRFKNEVKAIKEAGGKLVRINRPGVGLDGAAGQHRSETEQQEIPDSVFDFILQNDKTLRHLSEPVDQHIGQVHFMLACLKGEIG